MCALVRNRIEIACYVVVVVFVVVYFFRENKQMESEGKTGRG